MKPGDRYLDHHGRPCVVITLPITGKNRLTVVRYDSGHALLVDLAQCRPAQEPAAAAEEPAQPGLPF